MKNKIKVSTVVGARPQFIKYSGIHFEIKNYNELEDVLIHTGQHFDSNMSDIFFDQFHLKKPNYNLNIYGGSHGEMTGEMIKSLEKCFNKIKPDVILLFGDTNSTLAGAISGSKMNIPIIHIEAGLRSNNKAMPEEINRIITDHVSDLLFVPSNHSKMNLINEGISTKKIINSGDIMLDVFKKFENKFIFPDKRIKGLSKNDEYAICTIHRQENTDNFKNWNLILDYINSMSKHYKIIWPVHPRVKNKINKSILKSNKRIFMIEPLSYFEILGASKYSKFLITDSGGLQKEAYFLKIPCITLRNETEWIELVKLGWNLLVRPSDLSSNSIIKSRKFLDKNNNSFKNIYGNGNASKIIINSIIKNYI